LATVQVIFFGSFRELTGCRDTILTFEDDVNLDRVLNDLTNTYGTEFGALLRDGKHWNVYINGIIIKDDLSSNKVPDQSIVALMPIITAG
jgi:molybdopterin converting factor small subunit